MLMIDIPEPKTCEECPCSYWIRSGEYEGLLMCNALEFKERGSFHDELQKFFLFFTVRNVELTVKDYQSRHPAGTDPQI